MWLLRLLAVIAVISIGVSLVAYAFSGQRAYLAFARWVFAYALLFALLIFALMFLERLAIIPL